MTTMTVTPIELIWTVANVFGTMAAWRLLTIARRRRAAGLARGYPADGPRILTANRSIRDTVIRVLAHVVAVLIGLFAMADIPMGEYGGWALVGIMVLFMVASGWDLLDDRKLGKLQREESRRLVPPSRTTP